MATYSNRTCAVCGLRRPQYDMRQVEKTVKSGKSGISVSTSLKFTTGSTRINSGRNYYRKQITWECASSFAHNDPGYFRRKEIEYKAKKEQEEILKQEELRIKQLKTDIKNQALRNLQEIHLQAPLIEQIKQTSEYSEISERYLTQISNVYSIRSVGFDAFFEEVITSIDNVEQIIDGKIKTTSISRDIFLKRGNDMLKETRVRFSNRLLGITKFMGWTTAFWLLLWIWSAKVAGNDQATAFLFLGVFFGLIYLVFRLSTRKVRKLNTTLGKFVQYCFDLYAKAALALARPLVLQNDIASRPDAPELINKFFFQSLEAIHKRQSETGFTGADVAAEKLLGMSDSSASQKTTDALKQSSTNTEQAVEKIKCLDSVSNPPAEVTAPDKLTYKELASTIFNSDNFFDISCFILMCHVAHVDHEFSVQEKKFVSEAVSLLSYEFKLAEAFIAKKSHTDLLLKMLQKKYPKGDVSLQEIINNLFFVAESDGNLTPEEITEIRNIAMSLGVSKEDFEHILRESLGRNDENQVIRETSVIDDIFEEFDLDEIS